MINLISLGLSDVKDISIRAKEAVNTCERVFLESYTNFYESSIKELEEFFGKQIIKLSREEVESDFLIKEAKDKNIALLVYGDALSATTHHALTLEAKKNNIPVKIVHGSSILTAIAETGLFLYNFGKITSIPFESENVEEPYNVIKNNKDLHTLILLDIHEDKHMTTRQAIEFLKKVEEKRKENIFTDDKDIIICVAIASEKQEIKYGKVKELQNVKMEGRPQCLVIPGRLHFMEEEALTYFS